MAAAGASKAPQAAQCAAQNKFGVGFGGVGMGGLYSSSEPATSHEATPAGQADLTCLAEDMYSFWSCTRVLSDSQCIMPVTWAKGRTPYRLQVAEEGQEYSFLDP